MLPRHLLSPQSSRDLMTQSEGFSSFLIPSSYASLYETDVCAKHSKIFDIDSCLLCASTQVTPNL